MRSARLTATSKAGQSMRAGQNNDGGPRADQPSMCTDVERFSEFVVAQTAPDATYSERQLRVAVRRFVRWCYDEAALPLNVDVVMSNYVIERYVAELVQYGDHSRGTIRSRLREVARLVGSNSSAFSLVRYPRSSGSAPYTAPDIARFRSWAYAQSTNDRQRNASALLALGFGAGLMPAEIIAARHGDIQRTADGVLIRVTRNSPRDVPILDDWRELLPGPLPSEDTEPFLFRPHRSTSNPNTITNFIATSRQRVPLTVRRMRATWIVHQLDTGASLISLLHTAGLERAESLDPFLQFARRWGDRDFEMAPRR